MTKKTNALDALKSKDLQLRNAAMVYLSADYDYSIDNLHELTNLALSTVRRYIKKFAHLLEWARTIFYKLKRPKSPFDTEAFWVYIDKITMPNGETWCKIGQTTQTPKRRASNFKWGGICPTNVEVKHAIKCKDFVSMEIMENVFRIAMIKINPNAFCKNDRLLEWQDDFVERILTNEIVQNELPKCVC